MTTARLRHCRHHHALFTGAALVFLAFALLAFAPATPAAAAGTAQLPALITSAGQSSDAVMVNVLVNKQMQLGFAYKQLAQTEDLKGIKTLLVVVGLSSKGLGDAGINEAQETERVKELLEKARAEHIEIILVHTGGSARRGAGSDRLIDVVAPQASTYLVVATGNKDGRFEKLAKAHGATLVVVERITDLKSPLLKLFPKE